MGVHGLFVPWDVSLSDANLGGWLHRTLGYMAPPSLRVQLGPHGWCGELYHKRCPMSLLSPLGGSYSHFMTGDNGTSNALSWGLRIPVVGC